MSSEHAASRSTDSVPFAISGWGGKVYWQAGRLRVFAQNGADRFDLDWFVWLDLLGATGNAFTSWAIRNGDKLRELRLQDQIGGAWPRRRPRQSRS